ncbi:MAG: methionine--tRNA ligase [Patescibacteria group bacterium]|nr:methionine--tRNA ligase [Patescibacteria group bacterium]MDE1944297.1 methionine--tRNA ligase [Patescibacteria group bacterium]MDE1944784.1 methionine--tRNA ligase [Patescibacteria group bacterium]MDE2057237.1 methionine--tRNA ligase [Patescibacteria group bacterium]
MARYLTTTLPYVNADPHIGHALEFVQADFLARFWRLAGEEVFFNTGTDEHGQKIAEAAAKAGLPVEDYVDHYAAEFEKLKAEFDLSYDAFIRTTNPGHVEAAREMWRRCAAAGDIYKKRYTGLYCVGCEAFKTDKEVVKGRCELHPTLELKEVSEENYFFRFSKYEPQLLAYLERKDAIVPDWRRKEAIKFVKKGLEDFSISREAARLSWGIPVPDDETQVMYVWFDALTNYISTLGWPADEEGRFKKFWDEGRTLQVAGKDQVRFQSLMWQAMLMSAGVKTTDQVFYHGFITSGGQKMSKSTGNVINPFDVIGRYGVDALRYVLLRHVSPTEDGDLTDETIREYYTAHLVNGLGNLVARVMKLAEEHLAHPVELTEEDTAIAPEFAAAVDAFRFNEALDFVFDLVGKGDGRMTRKKPYAGIKSGDTVEREEARGEIEGLVRRLAAIAAHLAPAMPRTAAAIAAAVRHNKKPENLFPRLS